MKEHWTTLLEDWTTPLDDGVVFGLCCGFISIGLVFVFVVMVIIAANSR